MNQGLCYGMGLALCLWAMPLTAQVDVRAELDSNRILIGDQLRLRLTIAHPPSVSVTEIGWSVLQKEGTVEVLRPGSLDTVPGSTEEVLLQQELLITSFDTGYHRLPPIPVHYLDKGVARVGETAALALNVGSFPVRSDTAQLAPIKPIMEEPLALQDLLPYAGGLAALLLLAALIIYLRKRRRAEPPAEEVEDPRPAHEIALEKLEQLRSEKRWQRGEVKAYYSELTHILRAFLEKRFQVPALESTTNETAALLGRVPQEQAWKDELLALFRTADAVKFAKAQPPADTHEPRLSQAEDLVRRAIPAPEPEPSASPSDKGNFTDP